MAACGKTSGAIVTEKGTGGDFLVRAQHHHGTRKGSDQGEQKDRFLVDEKDGAIRDSLTEYQGSKQQKAECYSGNHSDSLSESNHSDRNLLIHHCAQQHVDTTHFVCVEYVGIHSDDGDEENVSLHIPHTQNVLYQHDESKGFFFQSSAQEKSKKRKTKVDDIVDSSRSTSCMKSADGMASEPFVALLGQELQSEEDEVVVEDQGDGNDDLGAMEADDEDEEDVDLLVSQTQHSIVDLCPVNNGKTIDPTDKAKVTRTTSQYKATDSQIIMNRPLMAKPAVGSVMPALALKEQKNDKKAMNFWAKDGDNSTSGEEDLINLQVTQDSVSKCEEGSSTILDAVETVLDDDKNSHDEDEKLSDAEKDDQVMPLPNVTKNEVICLVTDEDSAPSPSVAKVEQLRTNKARVDSLSKVNPGIDDTQTSAPWLDSRRNLLDIANPYKNDAIITASTHSTTHQLFSSSIKDSMTTDHVKGNTNVTVAAERLRISLQLLDVEQIDTNVLAGISESDADNLEQLLQRKLNDLQRIAAHIQERRSQRSSGMIAEMESGANIRTQQSNDKKIDGELVAKLDNTADDPGASNGTVESSGKHGRRFNTFHGLASPSDDRRTSFRQHSATPMRKRQRKFATPQSLATVQRVHDAVQNVDDEVISLFTTDTCEKEKEKNDCMKNDQQKIKPTAVVSSDTKLSYDDENSKAIQSNEESSNRFPNNGKASVCIPEDIPESFLMYIPDDVDELWAHLKRTKGWYWRKGSGLYDYYYIRPYIKKMSNQARKGEDYFVSKEDVAEYINNLVKELKAEAKKLQSAVSPFVAEDLQHHQKVNNVGTAEVKESIAEKQSTIPVCIGLKGLQRKEVSSNPLESFGTKSFVDSQISNLSPLTARSSEVEEEVSSADNANAWKSRMETIQTAPVLPVDIPESFLRYLPHQGDIVWRELRLTKGWHWKKGSGLDDYYYVRPHIKKVSGQARKGEDYFVSVDDVVDYVTKLVKKAKQEGQQMRKGISANELPQQNVQNHNGIEELDKLTITRNDNQQITGRSGNASNEVKKAEKPFQSYVNDATLPPKQPFLPVPEVHHESLVQKEAEAVWSLNREKNNSGQSHNSSKQSLRNTTTTPASPGFQSNLIDLQSAPDRLIWQTLRDLGWTFEVINNQGCYSSPIPNLQHPEQQSSLRSTFTKFEHVRKYLIQQLEQGRQQVWPQFCVRNSSSSNNSRKENRKRPRPSMNHEENVDDLNQSKLAKIPPELFRAFKIIVSGISPADKEKVKKQVASNGGEVIDSFPASEQCFGPNHHQYIMISLPSCYRKPRYVMAVIAGFPLVHIQWLWDSLAQQRLLPFASYSLPLVYSALHSHCLFPSSLPDLSSSPSPRLLSRMNIMDLTAMNTWTELLQLSGAKMIPYTDDWAITILQLRHRREFSTLSMSLPRIDYVVFDHITYANSLASSPTTTAQRSRLSFPKPTNTLTTLQIKLLEHLQQFAQQAMEQSFNEHHFPKLISGEYLTHAWAMRCFPSIHALPLFQLPSDPLLHPVVYKVDHVPTRKSQTMKPTPTPTPTPRLSHLPGEETVGERYCVNDIVCYQSMAPRSSRVHLGRIHSFCRRSRDHPMLVRIESLDHWETPETTTKHADQPETMVQYLQRHAEEPMEFIECRQLLGKVAVASENPNQFAVRKELFFLADGQKWWSLTGRVEERMMTLPSQDL